MTTIRVQVTLPKVTSVPRDAAMNTWHFKTVSGGSADWFGDAMDLLQAFYLTFDGFLSSSIGTAVTVNAYNLEDSEPRVPINSDTFSITPGTGNPLPSECAIAMSYSAGAVSGISIQRRRGRIFLGPWDVDALAQIDEQPTVDGSLLALIQDAAQDLLINQGSTDVRWCVFSPTQAGAKPWSSGSVNSASFLTTNGHIDDQFDTIRSRGEASTSRLLF